MTGARRRWFVLIVLLTAALSAAAWVSEGDRVKGAEVVDGPARPVRVAAPLPAYAEQATDRVHLEKLRANPAADRGDDAFAPRSWRKPPPKVAAATATSAVAPPPSAPPLPFAYMGKLLTEDTRSVFLIQGERSLIVHEGDVIDDLYRVDKLSDANLIFIHLPTGMRQELLIGEQQ